MKKIITFVAVAVVLMVSGKAFSQQTESWKGIQWECVTTGGITVTEVTEGSEYLSLDAADAPVMAYHCTDGFTDFRSASTPWVEVSFEDSYPDVKSSVQLWIRDACPPAASYFMTQIGTVNEDDTYFILWSNPNTLQTVTFKTATERSGGVHTIRVEKTEDGAVEYYIDDKWLWSTEEIPDEYTYQAPEYFGNIILLGQFSPATFTDYKFGNGYSPEPSSLAAVVDVDIDIRPFSQSNKIAHANWGLIPVAILSSKNFDAPSKVDRDSLTFGQTGEEQSKAFLLRRSKDVNRDGMKDLIIFFRTKKAGFEFGNTVGHLKGSTVDGDAIVGRDSVKIVKKKRWGFWRSHKKK
ncbi:MAG: hypothetical protein GWN93_17860 [Deltaproteobacteria bacterium]|nr:hypothetical protein [Deltaproteobacteria bacterium]